MLDCGALVMCCNVGGASFFFCGEKKNQNKFGSADLHFVPIPSNLHCPVKKLNPFLFNFVNIDLSTVSVFSYLLPIVECSSSMGLRAISYQADM